MAGSRTLKASPLLLASLLFLIGILTLAMLGPWLSPFSPYEIDLAQTNLPPGLAHPFGTDALGRDLFVRAWGGARISLFVGFAAALIDLGLGLMLGGLAGYIGGKLDTTFMRAVEVLYSIPYIMVVLLLAVILGPGVLSLIVGMTLTGWIPMARLVRGEVLRAKEEDFVLAATAMGQGPFRILLWHILPNVMSPVLVALTLTIPQAVFLEAFLAFIGLGVPLPRASLGTLITEGARESWYYPWQLFIPATILCSTLLAFNTLGDTLRDLLDPKREEPAPRPLVKGSAEFPALPPEKTVGAPLLTLERACVRFLTPRGELPAIREVSLTLQSGEMLALVGESGSGKSTLGRSIMGLLPKKGSLVSGKCLFMGQELRLPRLGPLDQLGKPKLAMVFQNPLGSLNPTMQAGKQVAEALVAARMLSWAAAKDEALHLFKEVGIQNQRRCFFAYPHELSGGMRQRVVFAVMLALSPSLLIADEPTTALDVATQARILALLTKLKTTRGLGILFITHNLALAKGWADRVSVLYAGEIVEEGPSTRLFQDPQHPYTKGLLDSIPKPDADDPDTALLALPGSPPDPYTLPKGCAFTPRCPVARPYCKDEPAPWVTLQDGHRARCFAVKEALFL